MPMDREVAGMRCGEVLEELSAYLDGTLPEARVAQIRGHLVGCDECERFGGAFAGVVAGLRRELGGGEIDPDVAARLRRRF